MLRLFQRFGRVNWAGRLGLILISFAILQLLIYYIFIETYFHDSSSNPASNTNTNSNNNNDKKIKYTKAGTNDRDITIKYSEKDIEKAWNNDFESVNFTGGYPLYDYLSDLDVINFNKHQILNKNNNDNKINYRFNGRIACFVLSLYPRNKILMKTIGDTWGQQCDTLFWVLDSDIHHSNNDKNDNNNNNNENIQNNKYFNTSLHRESIVRGFKYHENFNGLSNIDDIMLDCDINNDDSANNNDIDSKIKHFDRIYNGTIILLNLTRSQHATKRNTWEKVHRLYTFLYIYLLDQFDWFVRVDDDVMVNLFNLRYFLSFYSFNTFDTNPNSPNTEKNSENDANNLQNSQNGQKNSKNRATSHQNSDKNYYYIGHTLLDRWERDNIVYNAGNLHIINSLTLSKLGPYLLTMPTMSAHNAHAHCADFEGGNDDPHFGQCLNMLGIYPINTLDYHFRNRFTIFRYNDHSNIMRPKPGEEISYYWKLRSKRMKDGSSTPGGCCFKILMNDHPWIPLNGHVRFRYEFIRMSNQWNSKTNFINSVNKYISDKESSYERDSLVPSKPRSFLYDIEFELANNYSFNIVDPPRGQRVRNMDGKGGESGIMCWKCKIGDKSDVYWSNEWDRTMLVEKINDRNKLKFYKISKYFDNGLISTQYDIDENTMEYVSNGDENIDRLNRLIRQALDPNIKESDMVYD